MLLIYADACGWALASAHAEAGDAAAISDYLGKSDQIDETIGDFSLAYADQAEHDHAALIASAHRGKSLLVKKPDHYRFSLAKISGNIRVQINRPRNSSPT